MEYRGGCSNEAALTPVSGVTKVAFPMSQFASSLYSLQEILLHVLCEIIEERLPKA